MNFDCLHNYQTATSWFYVLLYQSLWEETSKRVCEQRLTTDKIIRGILITMFIILQDKRDNFEEGFGVESHGSRVLPMFALKCFFNFFVWNMFLIGNNFDKNQ